MSAPAPNTPRVRVTQRPVKVSNVSLSILSSCCLFLLNLSFFADPLPVLVAVPLSVGTNYTRLYFQRPQLGVIDGIQVCVCPRVCVDTCQGQCKYDCNRHPLPDGVHIITQGHLNPGSEYQLRVQSTSRQRLSRPFTTNPFKTGGNDCVVLKRELFRLRVKAETLAT